MSGNDEEANALGVDINEDLVDVDLDDKTRNHQEILCVAGKGLKSSEEISLTIGKQSLALQDLTDGIVGYSRVDRNNQIEEDLRKIRVVYQEDETVRRAEDISEDSHPGAHALNLVSRNCDSSDDDPGVSVGIGTGVPVSQVATPNLVTFNLATANPVIEEEQRQVAEQMPSAPRRKNGQRQGQRQYNVLCCPGAAIGIIVFLVLLIVFVYWFSGKEGETPPETPSPATDASVPLNERIRQLLPEFTLLNLVEGSNSDQMRAFHWLMADPNAKLYEDWRILQRFAMATIYYATGGEDWINQTYWLSYDVHENNWFWDMSFSVYMDDYVYSALKNIMTTAKDEIVMHLWLFGNSLSGTLPAEISLLTSLVSIDVSQNFLQGTIPSQLGNLENLMGFWGDKNYLSGGIPSEVGLIPDLHCLSIDNNQLTGTLPTEIALTRLWVLLGHYNYFTGPIPSEFGQLTELSAMFIEQNKLNSTIPSELGLATALQEISLHHNLLTGSIPTELGLLGMTSLSLYFDAIEEVLFPGVYIGAATRNMIDAATDGLRRYAINFGSNLLTGSIPSELTSLDFKVFSECKYYLVDYTGKALCKAITLDNNYLTGNIPPLSRTLKHFNGSYNQLTGRLPPDLAVGDIEYIDVRNNGLTGSVPVESSEWLHLEYFDISNNPMITGIIPDYLCLLPTGLNFSCSPMLCGCDCPCLNS